MFPSWEAVRRRYREVVIFTVGLMKDPRPLVDHIYEILIEYYLYNMRTGGLSIDEDLLKSLYTESTVSLPDHPLHNKYINYYNHREDKKKKRPFDTTLYYPSRVYHFWEMKEGVVLRDPLPEATQIPHCAMFIIYPDEAATNTLLSTCSKISNQQPVTDLLMWTVTCYDSTKDAPRMLNTQSMYLSGCELPDRYLRTILHQLFGSVESLKSLKLDYLDLSPFEGLLDELLEDLVSHHEARARAGLTQRKLELTQKYLETDPGWRWMEENNLDEVLQYIVSLCIEEDHHESGLTQRKLELTQKYLETDPGWRWMEENNLNELLQCILSLCCEKEAHYEAQARAGLTERKLRLELKGGTWLNNPTNLSEEFVKKWRARCSGISSIDCEIGDWDSYDDEVESDSDESESGLSEVQSDVDYNDNDNSEYDSDESESEPSELHSDPGSLSTDLSDSTGDKRNRSYSI